MQIATLCWPPCRSLLFAGLHVDRYSLLASMQIATLCWPPCRSLLFAGLHVDRYSLLASMLIATLCWPPCRSLLFAGLHVDRYSLHGCQCRDLNVQDSDDVHKSLTNIFYLTYYPSIIFSLTQMLDFVIKIYIFMCAEDSVEGEQSERVVRRLQRGL